VTVKDPGKALVNEATVTLTAQTENAPPSKSTDRTGRATFDQLPPGPYRLSVTKEGFVPWQGPVTVGTKSIDLPVVLKLESLSTSVHVSARRSPLANSDPNYQAIRTGKLIKVYRVSNLTITRDAGTFTFHSGSFSFLPPVMGHVTTGVFVGEGTLDFKTESELAAVRLKRMMGATSVNEHFTAMVIFFSDDTFDEIKQNSELLDESPTAHEEALKRVRSVIEGRREPYDPRSPVQRSFLETILNFEDIPNYDAEILAEIYNGDTGAQRGSFRAFLHGRKYSDLRLLLNPHGAMPMLRAPEEVTLIDFDPNSYSDGVWYLGHTLTELHSGTTNPKEDKRILAPDHYKIDAVLGSSSVFTTQPDLTVTCEMTFHTIQDAVRMVKLDLMPDLQVSHVIWNGVEIPFVQESRSHDGTFYLQPPEALMKSRTYTAIFEYAGGEIVQSRFGGVPPGRVWYPTPDGPSSRATYDLTFRIPQGSKIATVGNQIRQGRDGFWDMSQWTTDVPITQAAFRWVRDASVKTEVEETTKSRILLYVAASPGAFFSPPSADYMLGDVGNALRLFTNWFGKPAFDNINVLVAQGGASLPGLVYAPALFMGGSALIGSRISLDAATRARFDEAFPSLMSGQWWENTITPATFHDRWLSAGLEGFSASVYDLAAGNGSFKDRWIAARDLILHGTRLSPARPNDAGPVWMGILNNTSVTSGVGWILNGSKGAFIIQMLRAMMWDPQNLDRDFQAMMHDFVATFMNQPVSSEDFQAIVEKHMKQPMAWFFDEWLRGTDVPNYRLEYAYNGTELEGKLIQSGVSPSFRMPVPVYAELAGKTYRITLVPMQGNSTTEFKATLSARPNKILLNANHDILTDKEEIIAPHLKDTVR